MTEVCELRVLCFLLLLSGMSWAGGATAQDWWEVSMEAPEAEPVADPRLGSPRTLNDAYHPWTPPAPAGWEEEARRIRGQLLVATGHWPLPRAEPLHAVVHETVQRDGYCVDNVSLVLAPRHRITGNVYRPTTGDGPFPGVLCPHGHWSRGRLYDAGPEEAARQLDQGAERFEAGARHPLQARMVHLARMGCVVFHYDMVGYGSSRGLGHREGFGTVQDVLHLRNIMGLQTWNSRRALDYLCARSDVDPARIGVTGASGGGTQTFVLGALDPRPRVAFPAVMVSTAMQGGCVCENACYLRLGVNNVAFAALFAPRPLAMSGANDWTVDIETRGLPELRQVYAGFGVEELVTARCDRQFGHNYNQVARERMYRWFHEHLPLERTAPVEERDFKPIPPAELDFPAPDAMTGEGGGELFWARVSAAPMREALRFEDGRGLHRLRRILQVAVDVMFGRPPSKAPRTASHRAWQRGAVRCLQESLVDEDGARVPWAAWIPESFGGHWVLWVDGDGKQALRAVPRRGSVQALLDAGYAVAAVDVLGVGDAGGSEDPGEVNSTYAGYTFGYNRPRIAERVRDVGRAVAALHALDPAQAGAPTRSVTLVGTAGAGPWVLLACGWLGDAVTAAAVDLAGRGLEHVDSLQDPDLLPGASKYGGLGGLALSRRTGPLHVFRDGGLRELRLLQRAAEVDPETRVKWHGGELDAAGLLAVLAESVVGREQE